MKVSIDFWGTLGKSNPEFYSKKIDLLREYIYTDVQSVENGFIKTKNDLNDYIEKTGYQPTMFAIFQKLLSDINKSFFHIHPRKLQALIEEYQLLAEKYHPLFFNENTFDAFATLCEDDHELYLSCNTMFVGDKPITKALENWGIIHLFTNLKFSINSDFAKPHFCMYQNSDYHIGDNPITDGYGAELAGSIPIIINSNNQTLYDAINIIRNSSQQF